MTLILNFIDFTTNARKKLKFNDSEDSDDDEDPKYSAERVIKILRAEKSKVCGKNRLLYLKPRFHTAFNSDWDPDQSNPDTCGRA